MANLSLFRNSMDASDAVYYPSPRPHDHEEPGNDSKNCSVRGCTQLVSDGSSNKMCDVCRSRHRIYASTKRARRKLEKAAVANVVAARNGREAIDYAYSTGSPPVMIAPNSWNAQSENLFNEATSMTHPSPPHSDPSRSTTSPLGWTFIDPFLYSTNPLTSPTQHVNLPTVSSSELANALTLPPPRPEVSSKASTEVASHDIEDKQEQAADLKTQKATSYSEAAPDSSGVPPRFCSVKGCKTVLPASYEFKMCPPCRTRYRTYGTTKRAKWKTERAAFDYEMAGLRILEDKRREKQGLPTLADNPDELRAWELSILDEQIPLSDEAGSSLAPSRSNSQGPTQQVPSSSTSQPIYASPTGMAGVYPATVGAIDTPHSISPYPHLSDPLLVAMDGPLPARMCTVSHCHKILPGYYRYKRCEQHRLQNRHHSKLKRVREKGIKSLGPEDNSTMLDSAVFTSSDVKNNEAEQENPEQSNKQHGQGKEATMLYSPESALSEGFVGPSSHSNSTKSPHSSSASFIMPQEQPKARVTNSRNEMRTRSKYSCANKGCHNLLTQGGRWRTCDECRDMGRQRKMNVRAELKAAEQIYWKGVAQTLSDARRAAEAAAAADNDTSMSADVSPGTADLVSSITSGVNDEADAEGESDVDGDDNNPRQLEIRAEQLLAQPQPTTSLPIQSDLVQLLTHKMPSPKQTPMPPICHSPMFNSLTKQVYSNTESTPIVNGAFLKFRVELAANSPSNSPRNCPVYNGFLPQQTSVSDGGNGVSTLEHNAVPSETVPQDPKLYPQDNLSNTETLPDNTGAHVLPIQTTTAPNTLLSAVDVPLEQAAMAPNKRGRPLTKAKSKAASKKVTSAPNKLNTTGGVGVSSSTAPPAPLGTYGFPNSYPYYPYYMPPFFNQTTPSQPVASSSTQSHSPIPPRNYYHYPHPLPLPPPLTQPYGFASPLGAYPYLPPRYTTAGPNLISGQQPYPGQPPPSFNPYRGYPFYTPPGSSISAPPVCTAASPTALTKPFTDATAAPAVAPALAISSNAGLAVPLLNESARQHPSTSASPTHYQFVSGNSHSLVDPNKPVRKRRKVDTKNLEIYRATHVERLLEANTGSSLSKTTSPSSAPGSLQESSNVSVANPTLEHVQQKIQDHCLLRACVTKTCRRSISVEVAGTICEKCKLRFKKYQEKTRRKFKLEPRKFIATKVCE